MRKYGILVSLVLVFLGMACITYLKTGDASFLSPENLSNLSQQITQTGILAVGMTMVILIGGIDLSVGSILAVAGIALAFSAERFESFGSTGPMIAILCALAAGTALGAVNAAMISRFQMIPFIVTLGMLTIARGIAYLITGSQSIRTRADLFRTIGVDSIDKIFYRMMYSGSDIPPAVAAEFTARQYPEPQWVARYVDDLFLPAFLPGGAENIGKIDRLQSLFPWFTVALFVAVFAAWIWIEIRSLGKAKRHGMSMPSPRELAVRWAIGGAACGFLAWVFASHQGLPVMVLLFAGIALAASFLLNHTVFGRHLYALGGNRQAAHLCGVRVERCTFLVFTLMGFLCAVSGIVSTCRAQGAAPATQGVLAELEAIAAAVVGGTSLMGGSGTIGGTVIGTLIIGIVVNGMSIMALPNPIQLVFKGLIIVVAVWIDARAKRRK